MAEVCMHVDTAQYISQLIGCLNGVFVPKKIIKSADCTIVFWKDGTKTIVRRSDDSDDDIYNAFTAALAEKIYGSNSQVKKILRTKVEEIPLSDRIRKKKSEEYRRKLEARRAKEEAERPQKILKEYIDPDPIQTELTNFGDELRKQISKAVESISNRYKKEN